MVERVPGLRRLPPLVRRVDPQVVLFHSWWGRLADSPKAIAEELRRRDAPLEQVWVLDDASAAPPGSTAVRPGSLGYLQQTGRARYIVSNNTLPAYFRKKRATTYVQTWHGTPLKRIGFDIERPGFAGSDSYLSELAREAACWDYLVAPNNFSSDVFRGAFRYRGEILETGYPRNDMLLAPDRDEVRARVRRELGIGDGARAVLYAPTWRDSGSFSTELDLDALCSGLGDGYVVLLRAHSLDAASVDVAEQPALRDVSGRDDAGELLLAADVLVTDYSSVMFDFAVTRKPIVFFTYDLDHYRDEVRGFYFDFASEAPGPMVATTDELLRELRDLEDVRRRYEAAYERFHERFCGLEDGHAAARVVDAVFGEAAAA
jgi:CDP-glycerol glycerophosphotransferase